MTNPLDDLIFHQFQDDESKTFTYLLADKKFREAVIIDPVKENVNDYLTVISANNLRLHIVLDTHVHADHITGAFSLACATGSLIGLSGKAGATNVSVPLHEKSQISIGFDHWLTVLETPGHTDNSLCFVLDGGKAVFTGDTLLIGGCGRTDFQSGSNEDLFNSVTQKLYRLSPECLVYPGHDYKGRKVSSIHEEMMSNKRVPSFTDLVHFSAIMDGLGLPEPAKLKESLPANMRSGE